MFLLGKISFVKNHPFYLNLYKLPRDDFFKKFPNEDEETKGLCIYTFNSPENRLADIYLIEEYICCSSVSLGVHELVHAAMSFLEDRSFNSEEFLKLSETEKKAYKDEALPRVVERLTREYEKLIKFQIKNGCSG
jgi:hypothetical protein